MSITAKEIKRALDVMKTGKTPEDGFVRLVISSTCKEKTTVANLASIFDDCLCSSEVNTSEILEKATVN